MGYPAKPEWTAEERAKVTAQAICAKYRVWHEPPRDEFVKIQDLADIVLESTGLSDALLLPPPGT